MEKRSLAQVASEIISNQKLTYEESKAQSTRNHQIIITLPGQTNSQLLIFFFWQY